MTPKLTLGPLFYHWPAAKMRDFYFRIADEAPVASVYLGEVVCSKREPFFAPYLQAVCERLEKAGKQVVLSSLAMVTLPRELEAVRDMAAAGRLVEANDVAAVQVLKGKPFIVGPFINAMNEGAMEALIAQGATRIVMASELNGQALAVLAAHAPQVEKEVQIFGRQPLAVSMRCYHARANDRDKDHCRFACGDDPDGLEVHSLSGQPLYAVNGTQTLSFGSVLLLDEARAMASQGITHFRLAPQDMDMVATAQLFRDFLDGESEAAFVQETLHALNPSLSFINGFYAGREGMAGRE